jgi:hypothetical protein
MTPPDDPSPSDPTDPKASSGQAPPGGLTPGEISSLEEQLATLLHSSDELLSMLGRQTTQVLVFVAFLFSLACGVFPAVAVVGNTTLTDPEYVSTTVVGGILALTGIWLLARGSLQAPTAAAEQTLEQVRAEGRDVVAFLRQLRGETPGPPPGSTPIGNPDG